MIATLPHDPRIDNRNAHIFAVKAMLAKPPHPAEDTESVMWVGANRAPGDAQDLVLAEMAASVCRDAILLVFDNLRGSDAPRGFTVITVGGDQPQVWPGCRLWAPADGGPALLIAKDSCSFGWDGRLLTRGVRPSRHRPRPCAGAADPAPRSSGGDRRAGRDIRSCRNRSRQLKVRPSHPANLHEDNRFREHAGRHEFRSRQRNRVQQDRKSVV